MSMLKTFISGLVSLFNSSDKEPNTHIITLENHPSNIVTFTAASIKEACLKADAAMRLEGIQGAVWIRGQSEAFLEDNLAPLKILRKRVSGPFFDENMLRSTNGVNLKTKIIIDEQGQKTPIFESFRGIEAKEVIEPQRLLELNQLSEVFGECSLSSRYEMKETIDPHYDHWNNFPMQEAVEDKLFLGRTVRILVSRFQPATLIYNTKGENPSYERGGYIIGRQRDNLKETWQPAVGDYLFTCSLSWGAKKALAHSSPDFECSNEEECRILDVYDVSNGHNMEQLRSEFANLDV